MGARYAPTTASGGQGITANTKIGIGTVCGCVGTKAKCDPYRPNQQPIVAMVGGWVGGGGSNSTALAPTWHTSAAGVSARGC
jgi:hypothetical protein